MFIVKYFFKLLCVAILFIGCKKPAQNYSQTYNGIHLVSSTPKRVLSKTQLISLYSSYGAASYIRNGIKTYAITYKTKDYNGIETIASAAVIVPDSPGPYPLINYNHGTYFPSDDWRLPSYNNDYNSDINIGYMMASVGYVVVMPDYIGYGSTKNVEHNYCDYNNIAVNAIDAIRAAREFCSNNSFTLKNKLFLTGWSEGGAVAMAVMKKIQSDFSGEFNITATAPLAGAYYGSFLAKQVLQMNTESPYINSYAWVVKTYNKTGSINKPLNYYFNEPYASAINSSIESIIPKNPQVLFNNIFKQNYLNNTDPLIAEFAKHDMWNFKPASKTILCQGQNDTYVPLINAQKAYTEMNALGADVSLVIYPGKDHGECIWDYLSTIYTSFEPLR